MTESVSTASPAQTAKDLLKQLQQEFKVIRESQPLAIGIDKQLLELQPEINRKLLRAALGMHTKSVRYLKALQAASVRFNLDETTASEVSEEQRELASQSLRERFKKHAEVHRAQQAAKEQAEKQAQAEQERQEKLQQLASKFARK